MSTLRQESLRSHTSMWRAVSVEAVYPAEPGSVPRSRCLVTSTLRDWGLPALRPDAALVVTELAANAVAQGEVVPPADFLVRISLAACYVVIEVGDHNPAGPPAPPRAVNGTAEHGRGLFISASLSADLAWCRDGDWKIVWAVLVPTRPPEHGDPSADQGQFGWAA
jgi:Histidine kinase-like ATPase domain